MSHPIPPMPGATAEPVAWRFVLTVQPQTAHGDWHARLYSEDGTGLDFDAPIELLRHLAQLGSRTPPPGRLK
jgi:hypothetical protein